MKKITPRLWFDMQAKEAANSRISQVQGVLGLMWT